MSDYDGRVEMIMLLQSLIIKFQIADREIEKLSSLVWRQFGIDESWIQNEISAQKLEKQSAKNLIKFHNLLSSYFYKTCVGFTTGC